GPGQGPEEFFDPDVIFPDEGENSLVIQRPRAPQPASPGGPTLFHDDGTPAVYWTRTTPGHDPDFVSTEDYIQQTHKEQDAYFDAVDGDKIGGVPAFFQGDNWPDEEHRWHLLLQLHTNVVPFDLNVGGGTLFAFVDHACTQGRLLVQGT
ncbi:MAG: hypothetical protein AAFX99_23155, partial [Myxococcota bacterium]